MGDMRWGLVQQKNVQTLGIVLATLVQKETEARGIKLGQLPPEGVARGGFDCRIQPGGLVQRLDDLEGLHAIARDAATDWEVEAYPAFGLADDPHRLVRRLTPSRGNGAQAAGALLDKSRCLSRFFFAWLGRERFSFAFS